MLPALETALENKPRSRRWLAYLEARGLPIEAEQVLEVKIDPSCKMAEVKIGGGTVMLGNFWDFRPEVHGMDVPRFDGHEDLAEQIVKAFASAGIPVQVVRNPDWDYVAEYEGPEQGESVSMPSPARRPKA